MAPDDVALGAWADNARYCDQDAGQGTQAGPRTVCWFPKASDGSPCEKPIKFDDIDNGVFACGVHTPKYIEEKERIEAKRRQSEKDQQEKEIAAWMASEYQSAYDRLTELNPDLFPRDERPSFDKKYEKRFRNTNLSFDILDFERWVASLVRAPADS